MFLPHRDKEFSFMTVWSVSMVTRGCCTHSNAPNAICCPNTFTNHQRFWLTKNICQVRESMSQDPRIVKLPILHTPQPCHYTVRSEEGSNTCFIEAFPFHRWSPGCPGSCTDTWLWTWDQEHALCWIISVFFPSPGGLPSYQWCSHSLHSFSNSSIFKTTWISITSGERFSGVSGPPCISAFSLCWDNHLTE